MTREELKAHCEKQIELCKTWAYGKGEKPSGKIYEEHKLILELLEQESCDDAISRQWLMECVNEGWIKFDTEEDKNRFTHLVRDMAPPVTPQPKIGHWIAHEVRLPDRTILNYRCSVCGRKLIGYSTETLSEAPYCHCGAKMVKPQESEG